MAAPKCSDVRSSLEFHTKGEKFFEGFKKCHMLKIKSKLQFPPSPTVNLSYIIP